MGPYDLGNNLHHPMTTAEPDEELKAAIEHIQKAAITAGKKVGIYCTSGDQARKYADQGFQMVRPFRLSLILSMADMIQVSVVADMVALPTYMAESLVKAKGSYGHSALNMAKAVVYGTAGSLSSKENDNKVD